MLFILRVFKNIRFCFVYQGYPCATSGGTPAGQWCNVSWHPLSPPPPCLWATALTSCSAGSASWAGALSVSGGASQYRSACVMSPRRCATKSARTPRPPPLPPPVRPQGAPVLEKPWSPCMRVRIRFSTARKHASTTLNQRKGLVSGPQERNTVTARACGSKSIR